MPNFSNGGNGGGNTGATPSVGGSSRRSATTNARSTSQVAT
jgi:hypothetical protein